MRSRILTALLLVAACDVFAESNSKLVRVLNDGQAAFGTFVRDKTEAEARAFARNPGLDFLFYDMERGEFDVATLTTFLAALREGGSAPSVIVRIPPIHGDPEAAQTRTEALIEASADGVAFPHIMSASEAATAASWIDAKTDRMWPGNPDGDFVSFVMIEDPDVVPQSRQITAARGISIFSPGPGSLRGAYDGDMDKVRMAVETVLSACKASSVPCANTASSADIEAKVDAGFRLMIAMGEGTLELGRKAAGR